MAHIDVALTFDFEHLSLTAFHDLNVFNTFISPYVQKLWHISYLSNM